MKRTNRAIITTLSGFLLGIITIGFYQLGFPNTPLPLEITTRMIINITFLGFTIGISSLRWPWVLHGAFLGAVIGTIEGLASSVIGGAFSAPFIGCLIYGVLIDLVATKGFKASTALPKANQPI